MVLRLISILLLLLSFVALGTPASAASLIAPSWRDMPTPPRAQKLGISAVKCKKVLVIGDSIAKGMAHGSSNPADPNSYPGNNGVKLQKQLSQLGYCSTVYNEAISGSSACQWINFGWFDNAMNKHPEADFIVAHFVGNEPGCLTDVGGTKTQASWAQPIGAWMKEYQKAVKTIQAKADSKAKPSYWIIPAPAYRACYAPSQLYVSSLWQSWAHWQENYWPTDKQINFRANWGGDKYISTFRFSTGLTSALRTDTILGNKDCLHFTDLGYSFLANGVRSVTYKEWLK